VYCWSKRRHHSLFGLTKNLFHRYIKQGTRFLSSREIDKDYNGRIGEAGNGGKISESGMPGLLGMEVKIVTIVFWDIQGFSARCHNLEMSPGLLTLFLKEFFEAATQVILEQGGVVDKFLGDGVMALFGTDSNLGHGISTSAICAASAALKFRRQFEIMELRWKKIWQGYTPYQINIGLKCGINTGCAAVGNIGAKEYRYFTAFGINVNLANRLASLASDNDILVSVTTKSKIFEKFELLEKGIVDDLKNIPGSFEVFSVIRKK
jgi:adenylate cyclase